MIKLIALDLDGTLLSSQRTVSKENILAIQQALEKGVKVVLCTGRPLMGIQHILQQVNITGNEQYAVTFNGGLIQTVDGTQTLFQTGHSLSDVQWAYDQMYRVGLPIHPIDMTYVYQLPSPEGVESYYPKLMSKQLTLVTAELSQFEHEKLFLKMIGSAQTDVLDARFQLLPKEFTEKFDCFKSRPEFYEIMPKGINKANGLNQLCQLLNIAPEEVMAIGDEENDLSMIRFAGFGIAMGNATEEVKQEARDITLTNDEHGVAAAIQKYVLN